MLTYIGGMQITPGAMYAPSRTDDPPGTIRTLDPAACFFIGSVSLSKNGHLPCSIDTSFVSPNLKPSRMPCFTQALTCHPTADDRSGSAARTSPADNAARSRSNIARADSLSAFAPASTSFKTSSRRLIDELDER